MDAVIPQSLDDTESCLVRNISHYLALDTQDLQLVESLERDVTSRGAGECIQAAGKPVRSLFALRKGWVRASLIDADGRRQVTRTYMPGDVIGLCELASPITTVELHACEDVELCPFPKSALQSVLTQSPRLAATLLALSSRDQIIYMDLLRAIGCMPAMERVMFLLLTWLSRVRVTNHMEQNWFKCCMTQSEIGDLLGITNVTVSKELSALEAANFITRERKKISLLRIEEMSLITRYENRYDVFDTSWFPEVRPAN